MTKTASKTESGILGTVHKTAASLHRASVIDRATLREFEALCVTPGTSNGCSADPSRAALRTRGRRQPPPRS